MTVGLGGGSLWPRGAPSCLPRPASDTGGGCRLGALLTTIGCVLLVGCGGPQLAPPEETAEVAVTGTPIISTAPAPEASPVPSLGEIVWGEATDPATNAPLEPVTTYAPEAPRISAFVLATGLPAGSTITADWEYNDTTLDAFSRQIVVPTATDQTWISFHIDRGEAESWPAGIYEVTISLNGQVARQATIEVVASA
ncbi:MAG: hypothetical protein K0Q71_819 [Thermomicrobiales bacterium]|nr:hypothetical protein [Thermomicrobiales bacterium]